MRCKSHVRFGGAAPGNSPGEIRDTTPGVDAYTFHAGPAGWDEQQLADGTVIWTSPTGRTYTTRPLGAWFFPQLSVPTEKLVFPNSPPPGMNRELAMPKRKRTRAEDRAYRVQRKRALNRARYDADPPPF
jgi:hypothetical protein